MTGSHEQRLRYRHKVRECLDVFERMLAVSAFDPTSGMIGCELELDLIDPAGEPFFGNLAVVKELDDPTVQSELGAFNIEVNLPPRPLAGASGKELEDDLSRSIATARTAAQRFGADVVPIGLLPTLRPEHLTGPDWMSPLPRYRTLNQACNKTVRPAAAGAQWISSNLRSP